MLPRPSLLSAVAMLALVAAAPGARGAVGLNVDFGTEFTVPSTGYAAASGQAGSWNQAGLGVTALADVAGSTSGASVNVVATSDGGFTGTPTTDDDLLLDDNFFSSSSVGSWSVDLAGLAAGDYLVFLYAPSNGVVSTGAMTVDGVAVASLPGDSNSQLVQGVSWDVVPLAFGGGTLHVEGSGETVGLPGLQVVPLPDPGGAAGLPAGNASKSTRYVVRRWAEAESSTPRPPTSGT